MGSNGSKDYDLLPRCFWSEEDLELEATQLGRLNMPLKTSKSALTERVRRTHQSGMRRPEQSKVVFGWFSRSSNHWPFLFFFGAKPNWNIWNLVGVRLPYWSRQGLKLQSVRRERFGAGGMMRQNKSGDSGEPVGDHMIVNNVNIIFCCLHLQLLFCSKDKTAFWEINFQMCRDDSVALLIGRRIASLWMLMLPFGYLLHSHGKIHHF